MKKLIPIVLAAIILTFAATGCDLLTNALLGDLGVTGQSEETPPPATPASEAPAPTAPPSPTPDPAAEIYGELYNILQSAIDEQEYWREVPEGNGAARYYGILYADLIDFDNDGIFELFYVYGDGLGVFTYSFDIRGSSSGWNINISEGFYDVHGSFLLLTSQDNAAYIEINDWDVDYNNSEYYTIVDGIWTKVLECSIIYEFNEETGDFEKTWYINGNQVDENTYSNASGSLKIAGILPFDLGIEELGSPQQVNATLQKLDELRAGNSAAQAPSDSSADSGAAGWDASAPMQITTADGNTFTVPMTDWIDPTDRSVGGAIKINEPVGGIISRENNLQLFTLTGMDVSNDFGLTLVLEASTDEPFEIYLNENTSHGIERDFEGYGIWFDSREPNQYVTVNGRTMTIRIPAQHYGIDTYVWQFNCPEYQWYDESYNLSSDLQLRFAFLLEPGERPYEP